MLGVMSRLPLFVLPMVLLPGEVQELRVFEPRYRQMLDDCLLDGLNFGLVLNDESKSVNHWDGPMIYGCEAEIIHHETKGSNHFLQIIGRRRFKINEIFEPALPNALSTSILSMAENASSLLLQTITPLPAAKPSALTTTCLS